MDREEERREGVEEREEERRVGEDEREGVRSRGVISCWINSFVILVL